MIFCSIGFGRAKYQGIAGKGGKVVKTSTTISYKLNETYPSCTVTVYKTGTLTLAPIYSNNSGSVKANPFTADSSAGYFFYADNGRYDVKFSGTGIVTPFTVSDVVLSDLTEPFNVLNFGAACNGVTDTFVSINSTISAIVATGHIGKLQLPQGLPCLVSDITIPSTVIVDYTQGGSWSIAPTHTITIQGPELGLELRNQVYFNPGSNGFISFAGNKTKSIYYPENWGDSTTNFSPILNAAILALTTAPAPAGEISLASRDYKFTDTVFVGTLVGGGGLGAFTGVSIGGTNGLVGTSLTWNGATNIPFFKVSRGRFPHFHDALIVNNVAKGSISAILETGTDVSMQTHGGHYERLTIRGFYKGIESGDAGINSAAEYGLMDRVDFQNNTYGFYAAANFNSLSYTFSHCEFLSNSYGIFTQTAYALTVLGSGATSNTVADISVSGTGNTLIVIGWDGESGKQFIIASNQASISVQEVHLRSYHPVSGNALFVLDSGSDYSTTHSIRNVIVNPNSMSSGPTGPQFIDATNGGLVITENCTITNVDIFKNTGTYNTYSGSSAGVSYVQKGIKIIDNVSGVLLYHLPDDEGVVENTSRVSKITSIANQGLNYLRRIPLQNINVLRGISATKTNANNLRGQYTFVGGDAGVKAITFKRTVADGVTTSGNLTVTSATIVFNAFDVGKRIVVGKAGPNPIVSIGESGNSLGASATATINSSGVVTGIVITNGGVGFTGTPTVTISDPYGYGSGATATATVVAGVVTNIAVGAGGTNYGYLVTPIINYTNVTTVDIGAIMFNTTVGATLVVGQDEVDANYIITVTGSANETFKVTSKATTGFTITSSNNASTATVDWILVR